MITFFQPTVSSVILAMVGLGIFAHTLRIAYVCPRNTPNLFVFLVSASLGFGVAVFVEALKGNNYEAMEFVVLACIAHLMSALWLWRRSVSFPAHGIVSEEFDPTDIPDFINSNYVARNSGDGSYPFLETAESSGVRLTKHGETKP